MCGIVATLIYPQRRSSATWAAIAQCFTQNLLFNEKRGEAATGIAILQADGTVQIYKRSLPAHEFVLTQDYLGFLASLNEQTTLLLGHTRYPTKGAPDNALNNHPLLAGSFCGIHNGHILNDDQLFAHWQLPRQGEVDSEIIFRLLEKLAGETAASPPLGQSITLAEMIPSLQMLEGRFTFLASDRRFPHQLLVVRHDNPLSLHFSSEWNSLIFSSSYLFLRKTFGSVVVKEIISNDRALWFDAEDLPQLGWHPTDALALNR